MTKTKKIISIAILSAIAIVLTFISIPIIPNYSFLKIDFSDVMIFIIANLFGYGALLISACIKVFALYFYSFDMIGAIANLVATLVYVGMFYTLYKKKYTNWYAVLLSTGVFAIGMSLLNYLVFLPLYTALYAVQLGDIGIVVLVAVLPFNLIKGTLVGLVNILVMKHLRYKW